MAGRGRRDHHQLSESTRFSVRVTPRASRDSIGGWSERDGRRTLAVRLAAAPVDGGANAGLVALLAKRLGMPKSKVRIVSGETARTKLVEVEGLDARGLAERLGE